MGGGGGVDREYDRMCLFNNDLDDDKYNDAEDGKGSRRGAGDMGKPTTTVATSSAGHPVEKMSILMLSS
jgi:hypothetical protein